MKGHELAKQLLALPNHEVSASIDISTGDHDAFNRVFGHEVYEVNSAQGEVTICFADHAFNNDTGDR